MKVYTQDLTKSAKYSLMSKKKAYGHYCNLCIKYNFPRLKRRFFKSSMIINIEQAYKAQVTSHNIFRYRDCL